MRNKDIRTGCILMYKLSKRVDQSVMRWYGHIDRMNVEKLMKRIYRARVDGAEGRGNSRIRWLDGVRKVLFEKGMSIQLVERCIQEKKGRIYGKLMQMTYN